MNNLYGLVLEGGGAKGSYHLGVYKALKELGIEICAITGSSIGAINGAMIVQGDYEKAYDFWYNIKPSLVFNIDDDKVEKIISEKDITKENLQYIFEKIKAVINNKGIDATKIKNIVKDNIDEKKIRQSDIDFGITTISLTDRKNIEIFIDDIEEGKLTTYIIGSANHPAFKLEKMEGKLFLDGGVYDNLPINLMIKKGYKKIIAVRTFGMGRIRKVKENKNDVEIIYIYPNEFLGNTMNFSNEIARRNLKMGYLDAMKVFKGYKGDKYYIKPIEKDFFFDYLCTLKSETIREIGSVFGLEGIPEKRMLYEKIIPRISDLLGVSQESDYEDILIKMFEEMAESLNIEYYRLFSFDEFIEIILKEAIKHKKEYEINLPDVIKRNSFLNSIVKSEIIGKVSLDILRDISRKKREINE